jgi:predicted ATP-grasp superfamily ATP-dependent carboligase
MRILVHEFVSGGGLAGRAVTPSLAREGAAMLAALVADLAAIRHHQIITTVDARFPLAAPPGVEVVTLLPERIDRQLDALIATADAVWLVAPEIDSLLEHLAARAEGMGTIVLGPGASAIRRASDKAALPRRLARHRVSHPLTCVVRADADSKSVAEAIGYPLVVKPARGAGCSGVYLVRNARELNRAIHANRGHAARGSLLLQQYVRGAAASVSLLADGRRAVALTANRQSVRTSFPFSYRGGSTPLEHPLAGRAVDAALRTCRALPGLRGYVGVDLVLTESDAVVIEVNPRLTTAYLGARMAIDGNIAALALAACSGSLPAPPPPNRSVRFDAAGRILCDRPTTNDGWRAEHARPRSG